MNNSYLITIDGGTTNTRAAIWKNNQILAVSARETGAGNAAASGSTAPLKTAVRECILEVMEKASTFENRRLSFDDLKGIAASGMLTSNVGLAEIPHLTAPVTAEMLAAGIRTVRMDDICPIPISFIPGIKNNVFPVTEDNFDEMDMMRGEETETFAILKELQIQTPALLVLPGSHTKFVSVDAGGAVDGCLTTINGELLSAITKNTILANAVKGQFVSEKDYCADMVKKGAEAAGKTGLGRACFSGRILNTFVTENPAQIANFLLGAVLRGDMDALRNSRALSVTSETHIIIAGKNPLRQALHDILEESGEFNRITCYEPSKERPLSAVGAKILYEMYTESNL